MKSRIDHSQYFLETIKSKFKNRRKVQLLYIEVYRNKYLRMRSNCNLQKVKSN